MNKRFLWISLALLPLSGTSGFCDMGSISFEPGAKILEPNQRALIACNGTQQALILTTDLQSDRDTKVLEVMPFPAEPKVTKADATIFRRAAGLIREKLRKSAERRGRGPVTADAGSLPERPAGTVTFHEQIGAHNISVVRLERKDGFVKWAQDYLRSLGAKTPTIPEPLVQVIEEYMKEGYDWYVFDVVSLTKAPHTKEALQFVFDTEFLYFPLRIMRMETGITEIDVFVVTRDIYRRDAFLGLSRESVKLAHKPVAVTADELKELSEDIHAFLGKPKEAVIRNWQIRGRASAFSQDLLVGDREKYLRHLNKVRSVAGLQRQEEAIQQAIDSKAWQGLAKRDLEKALREDVYLGRRSRLRYVAPSERLFGTGFDEALVLHRALKFDDVWILLKDGKVGRVAVVAIE